MATKEPNRATSLADLYKFFSPEPLRTRKELDTWYCKQVAEARGGGDAVARFSLALDDAFGKAPFKGFLVGHQGNGKSTELTRLKYKVEHRFENVLHEADRELDPNRFEPFDVLLLTLESVLATTAKPEGDGGADFRPEEKLLGNVLDWLSETESIRGEVKDIKVKVKAGAKLSSPPVFAGFLKLFASLRGEMKYASTRKKETVEYHMSRISPLVDTANRIFDTCNTAMREAQGKEFLVVWEGFDKKEFSWEQIRQLFIIRGRILRDLHLHLIFTLPVALAYSPDAAQLPFPSEYTLSIPDTAVFARRKSAKKSGRCAGYVPNKAGRDAIKAVIESRAEPSLFAPNQMTRLIVASGGNLQSLFSMIGYTGSTARMRNASKIAKSDVDDTISKYRSDYLKLLGSSRENPDMEYPKKADRLVDIYRQAPDAGVPDPVLLALFRAKAAQEFNGERWFGVHPFVVDILANQGKLERDKNGKIEGGTI